MRKKLLVALLLIVMLVVQVVPVYAADASIEEQIKALPGPADGQDIISVVDVSGDKTSGYEFVAVYGDEVYLSNYAGDYKIIIYTPGDNTFWYNAYETEELFYDEDYDAMVSDDLQVLKASSDIASALSKATVFERGDFFLSRFDTSSYILFFNANATSLTDAVFVVKFSDLTNHMFDPNKGKTVYDGHELSNNVSVSLVEKVMEGDRCVGAIFSFNYSLEGYEKYGYLYEEHAETVFITGTRLVVHCSENTTSGSVQFTLDDINFANQEYTAYVTTDAGNKYYTTFTVDFASLSNRDEYTGSWDAPVITFDGLPDSSAKDLTEAIIVTIHSDIPARIVFNNKSLGDWYITEDDITISTNGTYYYTATSEVGQQSTGSIVINCFAASFVDNNIGSPLTPTGTSLVQTGEERDNNVALVVGLITVAVVLVVAGGFLIIRYRKSRTAVLSLIVTMLVFCLGVPTVFASYAGSTSWSGYHGLIKWSASTSTTRPSGRVDDTPGFRQAIGGYHRGTYTVRLRAFPTDPRSADQEYFTVEGTTIYMKKPEDLVNAAGYDEADKWVYFVNGVFRHADGTSSAMAYHQYLIQVFGEDNSALVEMYMPLHDKQLEFMELCGVEMPDENFRAWMRNDNSPRFNSSRVPAHYMAFYNWVSSITDGDFLDYLLHPELYPEENRQVDRVGIGMFLGLTEEEARGQYYIIAEQIGFVNQYYWDFRVEENDQWGRRGIKLDLGAGVQTYYEWNIGESYATLFSGNEPGADEGRLRLIYGENPVAAINNFSFATGNYSKIMYKYVSTQDGKLHWTQGDQAPYLNYEMGNRLEGYSIYSFDDLDAQATGANIAIEYTGDVDTSDPDKFVVAGSLTTMDGENGYQFYDFATESWIPATDHEVLLNFDSIDQSDVYSVIFESSIKYAVDDDILVNSRMEDVFNEYMLNLNSILGYRLRWGAQQVSGGDVPIGNVYTVVTINDIVGLGAVEERFETNVNNFTTLLPTNPPRILIPMGYASSGSGQIASTYGLRRTILDECWSNARRAYQQSSEDVLSIDDGETTIVKDEEFGVGFEFIIRGSDVESRKVTYAIAFRKADDGTLSLMGISNEETWRDSYTTVTSRQVQIDPNAKAWSVVVGLDSSIDDEILQNLLQRPSYIASDLHTAVTSHSGRLKGSGTTSNISIVLGSESMQPDPPVGYTVYEVLVYIYDTQGRVESFSSAMIPPGAVELPAWMLNRYFDNIIQYSSGRVGDVVKFTLTKDSTWYQWKNWRSSTCGNYSGYTSWDVDYRIEYADFSSSSPEFALDRANMTGRYYPTATGTWGSAKRSILYANPWSASMDTEFMPEDTYVIDYGFNLLRAVAKDLRAISGISYPDYVSATNDQDDMLRIASMFGILPAGVKPGTTLELSDERNSWSAAVDGVWTETFDIRAQWVRYHGPGYAVGRPYVHNAGYHIPCGGHPEYGFVNGVYQQTGIRVDGGHYCGGLTWYDNNCLSSYLPFAFKDSNNGTKFQVIAYSFNNVVYKYLTAFMDDGQNETILDRGLNAQHASFATNRAHTAETGRVVSSSAYRFSTVRYNQARLLYFPEAYMAFKIGGDDMAGINDQYSMRYVMGEKERRALSSSMYFIKMNTTVLGDTVTNFTGTVYSDTMQGGTGINGLGNSVSIPAGADVTVAANLDSVKIDLYGYALDIIQKSDDGKLGLIYYPDGRIVGTGRNYISVVKSDANVHDDWRNSNRSLIDDDFSNWVSSMLDVNNFAADFKLSVNGSVLSENFSATIGRIDRTSAPIRQDGVYQIVIEKGELVKTGANSGDYDALIKQIAIDYFNSDTELVAAEDLFEKSGIYQTIIDAMETCQDDDNNSGDTSAVNAAWTSQLGGYGQWYDETSRTFVIRRYTAVGNKIKDVVAEDKIDYTLAPTNTNVGGGENSGAGIYNSAKWYLSVFFDASRALYVNELLLDYSGNGNYYDPSQGNNVNNFNNARSHYSVLLDNMYVANADFVIPAASTSDFGH